MEVKSQAYRMHYSGEGSCNMTVLCCWTTRVCNCIRVVNLFSEVVTQIALHLSPVFQSAFSNQMCGEKHRLTTATFKSSKEASMQSRLKTMRSTQAINATNSSLDCIATYLLRWELRRVGQILRQHVWIRNSVRKTNYTWLKFTLNRTFFR